ncbi:MAG TPA: hypothetical protein VMV10_15435 [Pirellulales bacterium]|nr:hypothetical protein [Pirellulales bacterium]
MRNKLASNRGRQCIWRQCIAGRRLRMLGVAATCIALLLAVGRPFAPASTAAAAAAPGGETKQPGDAPAAKAGDDANAAQATASGRRRGLLRYARRSFEEWRDQLLNDLDPNTCIEAMEPMAAFGKRGYAAEATAALDEVLRSDRPAEAESAAGALAKIGSAALPALTAGLADARPGVRSACANSIQSLGAEGRPAAKTLIKLLSDNNLMVRIGAVRSLVAVAGDDEQLWPALERQAASSDSQIRYTFAVSLSSFPPAGRWWVRPLVRLADDPYRHVRQAAGQMLGAHAPAEKAAIDAVELLVCDDDQQVSSSTAQALAQRGNPQLLAAVFADGFESTELWQQLHKRGQLSSAIGRLASFPDQAEVTAPLLAKFIESEEVFGLQNEQLAAIDALGSLGPAAKIAFPVLKRIIQQPDVPEDNPFKKRARRALARILATDEPAAGGN